MKRTIAVAWIPVMTLALIGGAVTMAQQGGGRGAGSARPKGPCDIYAAAGDPCVAAHSTTRALYASYTGPLYQVLRQSDDKTLDIGVVQASASESGGYANAAAQDAFCANTYCWIAVIYDQSGKKNHLTQAPRGGFSGPSMGGFNNLPVADMAPVTVMGHKVYGVFIAPGMGLRQNDAHGTAVDDQAEGQYWVINGHHYNSGCCFDYGNAEIDSRDDDNGTMETTYYGNASAWYHGNLPGPWVMTDQENNLVGCVNAEGTNKVCANLPNVTWRFVTAMAKGEPHHWTSMGGDAQKGPLAVMFDGPRVDVSYDPMRKQGAILLGNGGDNSVGSQGTFYEGAMTAAGTFPSDATDRLVQANVVAAQYDVARVSVAPVSAMSAPTGLQTLAPGSSLETSVTFTNVGSVPASGVALSVVVPKGWTAGAVKAFPDGVAPGATVSATFQITSGGAALNGDLTGRAQWTGAGGARQSETAVEKVRNVSAVKINEFRIADGAGGNQSDSFIELYNSTGQPVDVSNWSLTAHVTQQASFSTVKIPVGTKLDAKGFYLLGLANSGLAVQARAGDKTLYVRSIAGMSAGDTISVGRGAGAEARKIASVGTAAGAVTTIWLPEPEGTMRIPVGSASLPVTSVAGFEPGEKVAIGYGATYPTVGKAMEKFEVATVASVGKPGTQAYLGVDAAAGATNLKVTSVANLSAGDRIRLDIDSVGHGIETVTVTKVGTQSSRGALAADVAAGVKNIRVQVRGPNGFTVGDRMTIGTPANHETVTITAVPAGSGPGVGVDFTPALAKLHLMREFVVAHGTGLDLAAPLKFSHAANLPFGTQGTGIRLKGETAFVHASNEPVQPLGTGITLDAPLTHDHGIHAAVRDSAVTAAGYQGSLAPNQWFGGPAFGTGAASAGSLVLRDAAGLVVDSLNYGLLVDPWAAEGYQAMSGTGQGGCRVTAPGGPANQSAGRYPDGADTDSNCTDFRLQPGTVLPGGAPAGVTNIKVISVSDFAAGQTISIDIGANQERVVIAGVGTAGATTLSAATDAGVTTLAVAGAAGFVPGQTVTVDSGPRQETATVSSVAGGRGGGRIAVVAPLTRAHTAGASVTGSGITLSSPLGKAHGNGTVVAGDAPTPGAPNRYGR